MWSQNFLFVKMCLHAAVACRVQPCVMCMLQGVSTLASPSHAPPAGPSACAPLQHAWFICIQGLEEWMSHNVGYV